MIVEKVYINSNFRDMETFFVHMPSRGHSPTCIDICFCKMYFEENRFTDILAEWPQQW